MPSMTTIKVPTELRDSVMRSARAEGLTAAQFLELLTKEHARRQRLEAVRRAYESAVDDEDYEELTQSWGVAAADGLPDA